MPLRLSCLVACIACLAAPLHAASSRVAAPPALHPWTIDDIIALRVVSDPQISPDARRVVYVVQSLNADSSEYQTDLWLASVGGGGTAAQGAAAALRLTTSPAADESPRWAPDGRTIAFLSDRPRPGVKSEDPADEARRQIWLIRPDGGEAWPLTSAKGGVSAFEWSRDGKRIAYLSREPKSDERRRREKEKDDAWTPSSVYAWNRLWVMDVASGAATQLTRERHVSAFSFSPDGARIAFAAQPTPLIPDVYASDLWVVSVSGGAPQPLVQRKGADRSPCWSPDGAWIAFVSQNGTSDDWYRNEYLCVVPAAGGTPRNLSASFDESVGGLAGGGLRWSADSRAVYFQAAQRTAEHVFRASLEGRVEAVTGGATLDAACSIDRAGRVMAFTREDSEHPRDVWVASLAGGEPRRVSDANPEARGRLSFRKELVRWKGADGWDIEGLLVLPAGYVKGTRVPLILNVHGGPAGTHGNTFTPAQKVYAWPLFAQQGYAILFPNPRGSGGYGERFRAADVRDWGGKDYEDLMAGVDAMVERGIADSERLAVCGWSYGGFMTSTIVTKTDRFKAAVVGAGVTDLVSMAGTCDIPEFNHSYFEAWPWEDPQFYVDHSAVMHANRVKTPTALVHGGSDDRVPTSQGWEFYRALKEVGVPTDLLILPRQPHGPREPRLQKAAQQWHRDWINRYCPVMPTQQ